MKGSYRHFAFAGFDSNWTLRYSLSGRDGFGYIMLNRAIEMAETLGIVNNTKNLELPYHSKDMIRSLKRTAWGLFQIDT